MQNPRALSLRAVSLSAGLTLSVFFALCALLPLIGIATPFHQLLASMFIGIAPTPAGFFLALVWGFLAGGLFGSLFAWIHNLMVT